MNCPTCYSDIPDGTKFCPFCGSATTQNDSSEQSPAYSSGANYQTAYSQQDYQQNYQQPYTYPSYPSAPAGGYAPAAPAATTITPDQLPPQYRPISAWGYFGYTLLFSLPVAGFVLLIVFSCSSANINRRNFARSYFCALLIVGIIAAIALVITLIAGVSLAGIFGSSGYYY